MRRGPAVAVVHVPRVSSYVGAQILCSGLQAHSGTLVVWYGLVVGMGLVWSGLVWYGMVWVGRVWYGLVGYGVGGIFLCAISCASSTGGVAWHFF